MKIKFLLFPTLVIICTPIISQIPNKTKGFSEFKLNYNLSFISDEPWTTTRSFGFGTNYSINDKFSIDCSLEVKPTKKEIQDRKSYGDFVIFESTAHSERTAFFMDLPIHANYRIINSGHFNISICSGTRIFYIKTDHEISYSINNQDPVNLKLERNNLNLGVDFGFVESIDLTDKIGLFASQYYGQALLGFTKGFKSTDLILGLSYNFK